MVYSVAHLLAFALTFGSYFFTRRGRTTCIQKRTKPTSSIPDIFNVSATAQSAVVLFVLIITRWRRPSLMNLALIFFSFG
jgi:hypothetical protein